MTKREIITVDGVNYQREVWEDPNFQAYRLALAKGEFSDLAPGTFVAFQRGVLLGWADTLKKLLDQIDSQRDRTTSVYVHQVNKEKSDPKIRGPHPR